MGYFDEYLRKGGVLPSDDEEDDSPSAPLPSPETPSRGVFEAAWDFGVPVLQTLGNILDTPARGVRSLIRTGSLGEAGSALFNPDQENARPFETFNRGEGLDIGDVGDLALNIFTDPLTFTGLGALTRGGKAAASAGRSAAAQIMRGADKAVVAREFTKKTGKGISSILDNPTGTLPGLEGTLSGRLRSGEQSLLSLGIPFTNAEVSLIGKSAAPAIEALGKISGPLGELASLTGPGRIVNDAAVWTKNFLFNPTIADATGEGVRVAAAFGEEKKRAYQDGLLAIRKGLLDANLIPEQYAEPLSKLAQTLGKPGSQMQAVERDALQTISRLPANQQTAIRLAAKKYNTLTKTMLSEAQGAGIEVGELGGNLYKQLGHIQSQLVNMGPTPTLREAELLAQAHDLQTAIDNTPNWVPLVATEDFMRALVKKGGHLSDLDKPEIRETLMRQMQIKGRPATLEEANDLVRNKGARALGGAKVAGKLPLGEAFDMLRKGNANDARKAAEAIGVAFETDPLVALEARIAHIAKAHDKAQLLNGSRRLFGQAKGVAPRTGWQDASDLGPQLKDVELPKAVYERLADHLSTADRIERLSDMLGPLRVYTRLWKAGATVFYPAFHARNMIGNMYLRAQRGAIDLTPNGLAAESKSKLAIMQLAFGKKVTDFAKETLDLGAMGRVPISDVIDRAMKEGVIGNGAFVAEVLPETGRGLGKMAGLADKLASKGLKQPQIRALGSFIEDQDRFASFVSLLRKGESWEEAAFHTEEALFNYHNVSRSVDFMRKSGLLPFAGWAAKNIPAQIHIALTKPGSMAALLHVKNAVEDGVPGLSQDDIPKWAKDKFNIGIKRHEDGSVDFVTADGIIPAVDLPKIAHPGQWLSELFGPIPKYLMEQLSNKDLITGDVIEEIDGEYGVLKVPYTEGIVAKKDLLHAAKTLTPGYRAVSIMSNVAGAIERGNDPTLATVVRTVPPGRIYTTNPRKEATARMIDISKKLSYAKERLRYWTGKNTKMEQQYTSLILSLQDQLRQKHIP